VKAGKVLKKYFKKRIAAIDSLLLEPSGRFTTKDYHAVRVEIKKLRALFSLLDHSSKNFKKENYYAHYKEIFRQAGKVRRYNWKKLC